MIIRKIPLHNRSTAIGRQDSSKKSGTEPSAKSAVQPVPGGFSAKNSALESDFGVLPKHRDFCGKCIPRPYEAAFPDSLVLHFLHRRIPGVSALRQGRGIRAQDADAMQACRQAASCRHRGIKAQNARCNLWAASSQAPERIVQPRERLVFADE